MAEKPPWDQLDSGDALFAVDADMRLLSWNGRAEELTGVPAAQAIGRPCWEVLGGVEAEGPVCHRNCMYARDVRRGLVVAGHEATIHTERGPRRVLFSTVAVKEGREPTFIHLMREVNGASAEPLEGLSPRQRQVLELLSQGIRVREIAARLSLSETTVRNHVRVLLRRLACHSQLEAVAKLRAGRVG